VADTDGQGDPAVVTARNLLAGQQIAKAGDIDAAGVQAVVEGAVTPSVLGGQGQFDQGGDRASQHRTASVSSKSPSARVVRDWWNSSRNRDRSPSAMTALASCALIIEALGCDLPTVARKMINQGLRP
jgi:hypothetical protein